MVEIMYRVIIMYGKGKIFVTGLTTFTYDISI